MHAFSICAQYTTNDTKNNNLVYILTLFTTNTVLMKFHALSVDFQSGTDSEERVKGCATPDFPRTSTDLVFTRVKNAKFANALRFYYLREDYYRRTY